MLAARQRARGTRDVGNAGRPAREFRVPRDDPDDLTEAERDDRQVVAAQPKRRPSQDHSGNHRECHRDGYADRPADRPLLGQVVLLLNPMRHGRGGRTEQRHRVRADREEADTAEVEQAGQPDHDVQTHRDDHVDGDGEQRARPVRALLDDVGTEVRQRVLVHPRQVEQEHHQRHEAGTPPPHRHSAPSAAHLAHVASSCIVEVANSARHHTRAFPSDSPRIPVGRNISTTTRTMKAVTSSQLELISADEYTSTTPRTPRPSRVWLMNWSRPIIIASAAAITITSILVMVVPPRCIHSDRLTRVGMSTVPRPNGRPKNFRSTKPKTSISANENPMAVIRKIRLGALRRRSGRYAIRSITRATLPDASAAAITAASRKTRTTAEPASDSVAPSTEYTPSTVQVPTMKTSECAKLMSFSTP